MTGLSNNTHAAFGKVGRPPNDAVRERLRIYRAAAPLIQEHGVRRTTMKDVGRAALISPGGIYHYFASKRELVLYGLDPEALSTACTDESEDLVEAIASNRKPYKVIDLYVEKNVRMLEFVRPAFQAAVELGRSELRGCLSNGIRKDADALVAALHAIHPEAGVAAGAADAIRRMIFGLAVDQNVTAPEARRQLTWFFERLLPDLVA